MELYGDWFGVGGCFIFMSKYDKSGVISNDWLGGWLVLY